MRVLCKMRGGGGPGATRDPGSNNISFLANITVRSPPAPTLVPAEQGCIQTTMKGVAAGSNGWGGGRKVHYFGWMSADCPDHQTASKS